MSPHPAPLRHAARVAAALALLAGPVAGLGASCRTASAAPLAAATPSTAARPADDGEATQLTAASGGAALAAAQDRVARVGAAIDDLKRALVPGHLTDPMPDTDRVFGMASLRADYADAQRRAAGYRATLGDQHPTLVAAEQLMEEIRAQLLDTTRKALASSERDLAEARADVASAERRIASATAAATAARAEATTGRSRAAEPSAAEVTGSLAAPPHPPARVASPLSLPVAAASPARPAVDAAPAPRPAASSRLSLPLLLAVAAAGVLAVLLSAWAALRRLLRPRRPRATLRPVRRVEPAIATSAKAEPESEPAPEPAVPAGLVPILQSLTLTQAGETSTVDVAEAAAELHRTLRAAFGEAAEARMTVLVAPAACLTERDADAAALALALAAAAAGRRPLLMEARAAGRTRGALAPADAVPMLIEAGGTLRTLYRLGPAGSPVALLPSDAGEAEAAAVAGAQVATARLKGLDAFDTVILVGDDPATLAASADLLLLAAPAGTTAAALAEAARPLTLAGRPCGAVMVGPSATALSEAAPRSAALPRRRIAATSPAVRLGLRGSIDPSRRRLAG